jgi:hypothetical protein
MRRRFIQINGELVEYGSHIKEPVSADVMPDIKPYKSMIDGSEIKSRSQHREHLKQHGCIEVGNETDKHFKAYDNLSNVSPQRRKELIRAQVDAMTHDQFRLAIKVDVDRVKWNSRER